MADQTSLNAASFTLDEVAHATGGTLHNGDTSQRVTGVSADTRTVRAGDLFVALRGEKFDGHTFLTQAASGAVAALIESPDNAPSGLALVQVPDTLKALGDLARFHRQRFDLPLVGVTGSYGKTTTRACIVAALQAGLNVLSSAGNFNNEIGVPMTLFGLDESHGAAVVEMAMRGEGQIAYLAGIARPTIAVITNIGPQHVELLGSVDNIARAKSEILRFLPPDGVAVLPADDPYIDFFTDQLPCRAVTFGTNPSADYHVGDVHIGPDGNISFALTPSSTLHTLHVSLPLPGEHNAVNAAAALAVADVLGVSLEAAARALSSVDVPGARMRVLTIGPITLIDDCYNAGPTSTRAALQTLRDWPHPGRRVAVLGVMKELGNISASEHRSMGEVAASCADLIVGVGEETRDLLDAASGISSHWCEDAECAARALPPLLQDGDVVLVKGSRSVGLERVVDAVRGK